MITLEELPWLFVHRIDRTIRKKPDIGRGDFDENDENDDLFRSSERPSPFDYFSGMPDKTDSTVGVEQADDKGHVEQLKLHVREAPLVSQYENLIGSVAVTVILIMTLN